tara:strand:+ start:84 stop:293 length:210 start_codon:yes stop_codon:yes gene_type:complete
MFWDDHILQKHVLFFCRSEQTELGGIIMGRHMAVLDKKKGPETAYLIQTDDGKYHSNVREDDIILYYDT